MSSGGLKLIKHKNKIMIVAAPVLLKMIIIPISDEGISNNTETAKDKLVDILRN